MTHRDLSQHEEHRWVPVTESGDRATGRSLESALRLKDKYPVGGRYMDGEPWDGIARIEHEVRTVTPWLVVGEHPEKPDLSREPEPEGDAA